jgi:hypothetical protein
MSKKCLNCGYDNRDTAGYCAQCQTALPASSSYAPPGPALPMPALAVAAPPAALVGTGRRFSLTGGATLIGRSPGCHVVLSDLNVSSSHAEIVWDGAQYLVRDLGSKNGTWLNGRRVANATPLFSGAQVFFGTVGFTFENSAASGTTSASYSGGTQAISPQQMQRHISKGAASATGRAASDRSQPQVSGKILSEPSERQEQPPPDPARNLVMLAVVLLFIGMLCSFVATLVTVGIVLLLCGGAALLFIVPFLWMPIQMAFSGVMNRIRDEKPVGAVSFQVQDDATGQVFDVGFLRPAGLGGGGLHMGDKVEVWGRLRGGNQLQARKIRVFESHGVPTSVMVPIRKGWPLAVGLLAVVLVVAAVGLAAAALDVIELPL